MGRVTPRLFAHELRNQQRLFWRNREAAFFTFLLPIVFLVLLGSVYGDEEIEGVRGSTYLLAGMIGYGVTATAFAGLAISLVIRRESGVLKRVRGTPLPPPVYVSAMIGSVLVVIAVEVVAQILIGRYALDAAWPASPLSFALLLLVGAASFAALGLAITGLVRSAEGSSAVVNAIYLPMTFLSGAFFSPDAFPDFLEAIAEVLPLTWFLRLCRSLFVDGETIATHPEWVLALGVWGLVGVLAAVRLFRWEPRAS
jgi:ABC-2 type transport system permease protein